MASVTISDIATRVGASRSAVSSVLNGLARPRRISADLEARVRSAARELDYRPSLAARSLTGKRTLTIGLLMRDLRLAHNPDLCDAIVGEANALGYQVVVNHH